MKIKGEIRQLLPGNLAEVISIPNTSCGGCRGCVKKPSGEMIVLARNGIGAAAGERVEIEISDTEGVKSAFLVFIFPIIGLLVGYFSGQAVFASESAGVVVSLLFASAAFLLISLYDKYFKSKKECTSVILRRV